MESPHFISPFASPALIRHQTQYVHFLNVKWLLTLLKIQYEEGCKPILLFSSTLLCFTERAMHCSHCIFTRTSPTSLTATYTQSTVAWNSGTVLSFFNDTINCTSSSHLSPPPGTKYPYTFFSLLTNTRHTLKQMQSTGHCL